QRAAAGREAAEALRIGCYPSFAPYVIPALLEELLAKSPDAQIRLIEGDQRQISAAMRVGSCEIALTYRQDLEAGFTAERLGAIGPHILLPEGHELAAASSLLLKDLAPLPLILLDMPPSGVYFLSLFEKAGLTANVRLRSTSFETVRGLVGHGLGYSLL